ncbi:MAG TPA: ATP-binding protein [Gemmatimonadaceae bacterium]|nr:ATP-binding protein [Gemmatimonadaceae bacterium]
MTHASEPRTSGAHSSSDDDRTDERFRLVVESLGTMIFDEDLVDRTVYRSDALARLFRWETSEPTEEWWTDRVHPDDLERLRSAGGLGAREGTGTGWEVQYRFRCGDGAYVTVLERGTVLRDQWGHSVRCVGTVSDVSDRAELAAQLRQAQKMEAIGQLAGGIAHDFNNLLTAISCNVELLLDATAPDDARRDDVLQIREAATRAATLTRQLLAFSRRQVLQPKPLDLNATVTSMERMLRRVLSGDIRLMARLEPELAPVYADAGQMEQVVMNLVLNARDAMPDGGDILITTSNVALRAALQHRFGVLAPGAYVVLSVRDLGSGVSPEVLDHLFEPFFTTKSQGKGTGLGLATVHGIIVQSGGQIIVDSELGHGTEFRIHLPVHAVAPPPRRATPAAGIPVETGQARTVLVVDDDDAVREVAVRALARGGYRVLAASGGESALALLANQAEHESLLILTDVLMPGMSGPQLAEHVASVYPSARIAFMSGFSTDELARSGVGSPMRSLLNKPFTLPGLAAFVERAFGAQAEAET